VRIPRTGTSFAELRDIGRRGHAVLGWT
jgi:hypothetical protein